VVNDPNTVRDCRNADDVIGWRDALLLASVGGGSTPSGFEGCGMAISPPTLDGGFGMGDTGITIHNCLPSTMEVRFYRNEPCPPDPRRTKRWHNRVDAMFRKQRRRLGRPA